MTHRFFTICLLLPLLLCFSCLAARLKPAAVSKELFGKDSAGEPVYRYTLRNSHGMSAALITYGATLQDLRVADGHGKSESIVLGFDNLAAYENTKNRPYYGATIGRYANRIAGAKFSLDGKEYRLAANNGPNTLHGGSRGFDRRVWQARLLNGREPALRFTYISPDMEEGFPGKVKVSVTYTLTDDNALRLDYRAVADKSTPLNLTNHSYFNLDGAGRGNILKQRLQINADEYLPVDAVLIPLGKPAAVKGTVFDFTSAREIGAGLAKLPGGYDHNWNLRYKNGKLIEAVTAHASSSDLVLTMYTTEPGVQIYISQGQDGKLKGRGGVYEKYCGFTLEAQHFPDSPHHPEYPCVILKPGEEYRQTTIYRCSRALGSS